MYKLLLKKPDGRDLTLYSREPLLENFKAPVPRAEVGESQPHFRWHPLREEWVAYATHRQNRTFLPPKEFNPLAPTTSAEFPTELPQGKYDIAVFDNLFASLTQKAETAPDLSVPTRPAKGHCEVVVFTQNSDTSLGALPLSQVELLLQVWQDRYDEISRKPGIRYILPFENRGVEVGVTLHHPHGQIYAYPFLPPIQERFAQSQKKHWDANGQTLLQDLMQAESESKERIVVQGEYSIAFIPVCARYPYEVWVAPKRPVSQLSEMTAEEKNDFARVLKTVLKKYDALWDRPFPYLMLLNAAPFDGQPHPEWHFHIQFYPPYRAPGKLKFLAGTELGAGLFINDSLPEEKAKELREVEVQIE